MNLRLRGEQLRVRLLSRTETVKRLKDLFGGVLVDLEMRALRGAPARGAVDDVDAQGVATGGQSAER